MQLPSATNAEVFKQPNMEAVKLGRFLFFDPILSGNKNIACATCHHPSLGTSDGLSLSIGEGGKGLGHKRYPVAGNNMPEQRIARNSPALFNLGASEFVSLFHDGRLEADSTRDSGIRTPLEDDMVQGFDSVLSAQSMFPVLSGDEMAGHYSENEVSIAVRKGLLTNGGGAWDVIANRVQAIPEYVGLFRVAYPGIGEPTNIRFTDISNAVADFIAFEFRADSSPFDRHLNGKQSLKPEAFKGMQLFYGKANCAACHSGLFQTDHAFHAIAMPQLGPGKAARFENHNRDVGRMRVTGKRKDQYKFRTPSLRNIELTAPYGHVGAYATLEGVVRHHLAPIDSLRSFDRDQVLLPGLPGFPGLEDWWVMNSAEEMSAIAEANELEPIGLTDTEIAQLLSFLGSLTDPISREGRLGVPLEVPSGLPVDRPK